MALAMGMANSEVEFVFPTSEEVGHPSVELCRCTRAKGRNASGNHNISATPSSVPA